MVISPVSPEFYVFHICELLYFQFPYALDIFSWLKQQAQYGKYGYWCPYPFHQGFPGGSEVKASAWNAGDPGSSLGWEDPLEKEMATHSSTLAWRIPWREEPGRLQSMGSQRVGHDWATSLSLSPFPLAPPLSSIWASALLLPCQCG